MCTRCHLIFKCWEDINTSRGGYMKAKFSCMVMVLFLIYVFFLMFLCWCPCVWCIVKPRTNFHLWTINYSLIYSFPAIDRICVLVFVFSILYDRGRYDIFWKSAKFPAENTCEEYAKIRDPVQALGVLMDSNY